MYHIYNQKDSTYIFRLISFVFVVILVVVALITALLTI